MNKNNQIEENCPEPEIQLTYPAPDGITPSSCWYIHPDNIDYVEPNGNGCVVIAKDGGRLPAKESKEYIEEQRAKYR